MKDITSSFHGFYSKMRDVLSSLSSSCQYDMHPWHLIWRLLSWRQISDEALKISFFSVETHRKLFHDMISKYLWLVFDEFYIQLLMQPRQRVWPPPAALRVRPLTGYGMNLPRASPRDPQTNISDQSSSSSEYCYCYIQNGMETLRCLHCTDWYNHIQEFHWIFYKV